MANTLYYIHDPMCSWCWGFRPTWDELTRHLTLNKPSDINIQNVVGGLAPDTNLPMPLELQQTIQHHWRRIQNLLGTEFNFDFWTNNQPRRSTYLACRAVISASKLQYLISIENISLENEMINAIQQGYYLRAMNPSDAACLTMLFAEICEKFEINSESINEFNALLSSEDVEHELQRQITLARILTESGFPSLVMKIEDNFYPVSVNYKDWSVMNDEILALMH